MNFKKMALILSMGICLPMLAACSNNQGNVNMDDSFTNSNLVGYFPHRLFDVSMYDALQLIEDETFNGILYFGFPRCPWCRASVPVMIEASNELEVDIFYVSRAHDLREGVWNEWDAKMAWWLEDQIEMQWHEFEDGTYRPNIFVPLVVHINNGIVVDSHRGTFSGHEHIYVDGVRILPELTDLEFENLLNIYKRTLSGVNNSGECNVIDPRCS